MPLNKHWVKRKKKSTKAPLPYLKGLHKLHKQESVRQRVPEELLVRWLTTTKPLQCALILNISLLSITSFVENKKGLYA